MKNPHRRCSTIIFLALLLSAGWCIAQDNGYEKRPIPFQFINNFDKGLHFEATINPEVASRLPRFLASDDSAEIFLHRIKGKDGELYKPVYIRAADRFNHSAFFAIEIKANSLEVHGYLGIGIAYSWQAVDPHLITFCTPEEYAKKGHC